MSVLRRLPPMHALAAFEAAARLGTFSRAADELCITQSAVSHRIRHLEEQLGMALFERGHMQVVLTAAGAAFLQEVSQAIQSLGAACESLKAPVSSKLKVTASPAVATQILIPNLAELSRTIPGLQIELDASSRSAELDRGDFDVALRFGRGPWPGCQSRRILEDRIVALCSPEYASRFEGRRSLGSLDRATLLDSPPCSWDSWLRQAGRVPVPRAKVRPQFKDNWTALEAARHGLGVVLTSRFASLSARQSGALVPFVEIEVDSRQHYYGLYPEESPKRVVIEQLIDWTGAQMEKLVETSAELALVADRGDDRVPTRTRHLQVASHRVISDDVEQKVAARALHTHDQDRRFVSSVRG